VREDKVLVEVDGFLVVFSGLAEFSFDKVELGAMVVDIGIVLVLGKGGGEVSFGGVRVGFCS
jgi:hypothetical protein